MLFDMGYEQTITVTTEPMLFPLDIAFLSEALEVTEVYPNVAPGYQVNSIAPARYFLEVNAGELEGITEGKPSGHRSYLILQTSSSAAPDWVYAMTGFMGLVMIVMFAPAC